MNRTIELIVTLLVQGVVLALATLALAWLWWDLGDQDFKCLIIASTSLYLIDIKQQLKKIRDGK